MCWCSGDLVSGIDHREFRDHARTFVPGNVTEHFVDAGFDVAKVEGCGSRRTKVACHETEFAHPDVVCHGSGVPDIQDDFASGCCPLTVDPEFAEFNFQRRWLIEGFGFT